MRLSAKTENLGRGCVLVDVCPYVVEQLVTAWIFVWRSRMGLAPLALVICDSIAAALPARRAASVNSVEALRVE